MNPYVSVSEAIEDLPELGASGRDDSVPNHDATHHRQATVERIHGTEWGEQLYDSWKGMVRLDPTEPTRTLDAGGTSTRYQFGHYAEPRPLTVRERARIQTFPDDFVFPEDIAAGRSLTGNAVPVQLAESIGGVMG